MSDYQIVMNKSDTKIYSERTFRTRRWWKTPNDGGMNEEDKPLPFLPLISMTKPRKNYRNFHIFLFFEQQILHNVKV
jgi:hypothetical protein